MEWQEYYSYEGVTYLVFIQTGWVQTNFQRSLYVDEQDQYEINDVKVKVEVKKSSIRDDVICSHLQLSSIWFFTRKQT